MRKEYIKLKLADLIPYENNPRKNDDAVPYVAESIEQCGYITPIVVDENNVILAGHTRLKALLKIGGVLMRLRSYVFQISPRNRKRSSEY